MTAAKPSILTFDTLEDRKALWHLLHRLSPRDRVAFLHRACRSVSKPNAPCPIPEPAWWDEAREAERCDRADEKLTTETFLSLASISAEYGFDLLKAAVALEAMVRARR
jgi:hypothetical protein